MSKSVKEESGEGTEKEREKQGRRVEYDPLSVNEYQKQYEEQQACVELVEA